MPSQAEMKAAMKAYVERFNARDLDGVLALYADNATVEDPVGSPVHSGAAAVRAFYEYALGGDAKISRLAGPYATAGRSGAMAIEVTVAIPGMGATIIGLVEIMDFDDDGRIVAMRAFWGHDDMRSA